MEQRKVKATACPQCGEPAERITEPIDRSARRSAGVGLALGWAGLIFKGSRTTIRCPMCGDWEFDLGP